MYTQHVVHLRALIGLWATSGLTDVLKLHVFGDSCPRPKGARDCNFWANNGNQEDKPGAISTFFSAFYYQQTDNP